MIRLKKRRRQCKHCRKLFIPDHRNAARQKYCGTPECRKASKSAAQARWRKSEKGRDYHRGPENVLRVQMWRKENPGYWRRKRDKKKNALQDPLTLKTTEQQVDNGDLLHNALQDVLSDYLAVIVGLIAKLTDSVLQDDIVNTSRHLQQLGTDILTPSHPNQSGGNYERQTSHLPP